MMQLTGQAWTGFRVGAAPAGPATDPGRLGTRNAAITIYGGRVWHGRVDGADQPVDIMTPQMQPGEPQPEMPQLGR